MAIKDFYLDNINKSPHLHDSEVISELGS